MDIEFDFVASTYDLEQLADRRRRVHEKVDGENETITEILECSEGLRPAELQQTYGMTKLAETMCLSDDPPATRNHNLLPGREN